MALVKAFLFAVLRFHVVCRFLFATIRALDPTVATIGDFDGGESSQRRR
jgi:hypothetical protein